MRLFHPPTSAVVACSLFSFLACGSLDEMKGAPPDEPGSSVVVEQPATDDTQTRDDSLLPTAPTTSGTGTTTDTSQGTTTTPMTPATPSQNDQQGTSTQDPAEQMEVRLMLGGNVYNTAVQGDSAGSSFHVTCPSGRVMVGLEGATSNKVESLRLACSTFIAGSFGPRLNGVQDTDTIGEGGEHDFTLDCYDNNVIRGIAGVYREGLCELKVICNEVRKDQFSTRSATFEVKRECDGNIPLIDTKEKKTYSATCGTMSLAIGVHGRVNSGYLTAIGLICLDVVRTNVPVAD